MTTSAQVSARKGAPVWLDMDQKALDDAYDQEIWARNSNIVRARRAWQSEDVRQRLGQPLRLAYGATPVEGMDVYVTSRPNAPIAVFIHGGAWRTGTAKDNAYFAEAMVRAGAHAVVLDFISVDDAGGDLMPMVRQVRSAVAWLYTHAREAFGGNRDRIHVAGQSSGGHIAGNVVTTDWQGEFGLPHDVVKGGILCSGMYDLKPVRMSKRSEYVNFTDEMEEALSAQRHLDRLHCPVVVLYGTEESPEFIRQSVDFAAALKAAGKVSELRVAPHYNHFEMAESLGNPYGPMGRAMLEQLGLA